MPPRTRKPLPPNSPAPAPCLIFADADLDQATDGALFGAFALNGQRRTATSTILAERPVYDDLVSRLARRAKRIRVGAPSDPCDADRAAAARRAPRQGQSPGVRLGRQGRRPAGGRRDAASQPARGQLPRRDRARQRHAVRCRSSPSTSAGRWCASRRSTPRRKQSPSPAPSRTRQQPTSGPPTCSARTASRQPSRRPDIWVNLTTHATCGRRRRPGRQRRRTGRTQHRLLHPVPDRADRWRRHASAAVRRLSGRRCLAEGNLVRKRPIAENGAAENAAAGDAADAGGRRVRRRKQRRVVGRGLQRS